MVGARFGLGEAPARFRQVHGGHVHETYIASYGPEPSVRRYVHQRLSPVFADVAGLMSNVALICAHLEAKRAGRAAADASVEGSRGRGSLKLLTAIDGAHHWVDPDQRAWRTFEMVEGAHAFERVRTPRQAFQVGSAFGSYLAILDDLATSVTPDSPSCTPVLCETIPRFHDLDRYLDDLDANVEEDAAGRMASAAVEATVREVLLRRWIAGEVRRVAEAGALPLRTVHNDCKSANVLGDDLTGEWVCVIDLDTTMSGYVMHDFGDIVRTATVTAAEDVEDPARSGLDLDLFTAAARGYLKECGSLLSDAELESLALGAVAMAYEAAVRFLADHLRGDTYFHVAYPGQNLRRSRAQLALVDSFVVSMEAMAGIIRAVAAGDARPGQDPRHQDPRR